MSLNIYKKEMIKNLRSLLIWTTALVAFIMFGMAFYPVLMNDEMVGQIKGLLNSPLMKTMLEVIGVGSFESMMSPLGFYNAYGSIYVTLLASMYAILLGANLISQEESKKTADFLLTKPITRGEAFTSKLCVYITNVFILNIITFIFGFISIEMFKLDKTYSFNSLIILSVYSFLCILLFGAAGMFIAVIVKRGRSMTGLGIGIALIAYFINGLSNITREASIIGYLSPMKFIGSDVGSPDYGFEWWRLLYFIGVFAILTVAGYMIYRKKDILV